MRMSSRVGLLAVSLGLVAGYPAQAAERTRDNPALSSPAHAVGAGMKARVVFLPKGASVGQNQAVRSSARARLVLVPSGRAAHVEPTSRASARARVVFVPSGVVASRPASELTRAAVPVVGQVPEINQP